MNTPNIRFTSLAHSSPRPASRFAAVRALLVAGLCWWLSGCATSESAPPAEPVAGVLRVGVTATMPPMIFKQGKEYAGIEADLARKLAASLGKTLRFVDVPWEKQMDWLMEGRIDIIMSNLSVTPARAMRLDYTAPYLSSGQVALARRSEAMGLRIGMYTGDCRAGAQEATTGDYYIQQDLPRAKRVTLASAEAGARALLDKRIDVFIHDAPVSMWLASEYEARGLTVIPTFLTKEQIAWGVRKGNAELRDAANQYLEKARQSGELLATIRQWLPQWN